MDVGIQETDAVPVKRTEKVNGTKPITPSSANAPLSPTVPIMHNALLSAITLPAAANVVTKPKVDVVAVVVDEADASYITFAVRDTVDV